MRTVLPHAPQLSNAKEKKGPRAKERKEVKTIPTGFKVRMN
jgi:hypothetical protein